jgi:hypothetical protein
LRFVNLETNGIKGSSVLAAKPIRIMSMASRSTCIALLALFALATYTSAASDAGEPGRVG